MKLNKEQKSFFWVQSVASDCHLAPDWELKINLLKWWLHWIFQTTNHFRMQEEKKGNNAWGNGSCTRNENLHRKLFPQLDHWVLFLFFCLEIHKLGLYLDSVLSIQFLLRNVLNNWLKSAFICWQWFTKLSQCLSERLCIASDFLSPWLKWPGKASSWI